MFLIGFIAGVSVVTVPLGVLYAKGFFNAYINKPVVTIDSNGIEVKPENGEAKQ